MITYLCNITAQFFINNFITGRAKEMLYIVYSIGKLRLSGLNHVCSYTGYQLMSILLFLYKRVVYISNI